MTAIRHGSIRANGIRMHVAEAGAGVPVVMCHGWPELWYSWRHQLPALAAAGFRAIAPDMRGYGETDAPADPTEYRTSVICADIAGLLDALGLDRAVIVGHDWGGHHVWQFGLRHPERCLKLVGLNTPYGPPGPVPPTQALRARFGEDGYYMLWHQTPGRSEAELEADLRGNLRKIFKGFEHAGDLWTMATLGGGRGSLLGAVSTEGCFLTEAELDVYVAAFRRTGTRGSFNWYRALDRNWEEERRITDPTIRVPALMITAENDPILTPARAAGMPQWIPGLRIANIPRCSHWTQQERPAEVNRLLLEFLADLG
jgi:pimeloyl-ACP methyl ester carboxylesterase